MYPSRLANAALLLAFLCAAPAAAGVFAKKATVLTDIVGSSRPMTISAPDDRTRAVARFTEDKEEDTLIVYLGTRGGFRFPGGPDAELLWAPDSRALAVTYEDDEERMRTALLVRRKPHGWRRLNLAEAVAKVYRAPAGCAEDMTPDVVTLGWTSGQRLIVAATMPEKADCPVKGRFTAYFVDVPTGKVLMEVDQRTAERRYRAMLGKRLAPARHHGTRHHRRHRAD
ncbi:hypothetical protein [Sphingomonas sp. PR090111-T3T-6A]|uniref:hypothetical protein n=1 Tax=Sphingomonas sp. PR090111-T3T-6A TaxID=685778 RepID=UPI00037ED5E8|nr:hypothetical protein [Sphingomonas sp. PR090111-T3T-6A]